jgi:hypothetical protein
MENPYIVFVRTNSNGYITDVNSSAFLTDTADWTEIDRGFGDKYHHAQGNYFDDSVVTEGGAYRYKLVDGKAVVCTPEEMAQQDQANQKTAEPTHWDMLEAQVTYTAMMTDTLLGV